jgi:hypothetical protein
VLRDEEGDMSLRVLVCDQTVSMVMGGGEAFDFRDYMEHSKDADVVIDARQPVIAELLKFANTAWELGLPQDDAGTAVSSNQKLTKSLVFDTTDKVCY